jgi:hypothetical protein
MWKAALIVASGYVVVISARLLPRAWRRLHPATACHDITTFNSAAVLGRHDEVAARFIGFFQLGVFLDGFWDYLCTDGTKQLVGGDERCASFSTFDLQRKSGPAWLLISIYTSAF